MTDFRGRREDDIDDLWNALVRGENPDAGNLDTESAGQIRELHTLLHTQPPAGASERVQNAVMAEVFHRKIAQNGKGTHVEQSITPAGTVAQVVPGSRLVTHQPGRGSGATIRRPASSIASWIGAAAIALTIAFLSFLIYRSNSQYGAIPPVLVASPTAEATPASSFTDPYVQFLWSSQPTGSQTMSNPITARLAPDGRLWVADVSSRWFIFSSDGVLEETWGGGGTEPGQFNFRYDYGNGTVGEVASILFVDDGSFYIADAFNHRIQHFDEDRNFIASWGTKGSADGEFLLPTGITRDNEGMLLVTDVERGDIQKFTPDGQYISTFDASGTPNGQLVSPLVSAIDAANRLSVVEVEANRIRVFDPSGAQLLSFGLSTGDFDGLRTPVDIALDGDGMVFVSDQENNRIVVFDSDGNVVHSWGTAGTGDGQFQGAGSVVLGPDKTVFVVDWEGGRVQKFRITGDFPAASSGS